MALYDVSGNVIVTGGSGGDSFFKEIETMQNGLQLPAVPSNFQSTADWKYAGNSGNLHSVIGVKYMYLGRVFTGTVYVRSLTRSVYTEAPTKMYLVAADYITNPTAEGVELVATRTVRQFDGQFLKVYTNGTYTATNNGELDGGNGGMVAVQKFDIPDGKCAILVAANTGNNSGNSINVNGWNTVFTTDPSEDITQIPDGAALKAITALNEDGFGKGTVENAYFQRYLREQVDKFMPSHYKPQTYGKSLFVAGDSLHAYAGGNGFDAPGFISTYNKYLGFTKVTNAGYAGATMSGTGTGGGIHRAKKLIEDGEPYDVIIFAYGTNHDTNGLGTATDAASDTALTLAGSMKWIIQNLRTAFPKTAIGFVILPPSGNADQSAKRQLMIEVCEAENVPYVDMFNHVSKGDLSDGTHLGAGGGIKYGAAEAKLILDICPYCDPLT